MADPSGLVPAPFWRRTSDQELPCTIAAGVCSAEGTGGTGNRRNGGIVLQRRPLGLGLWVWVWEWECEWVWGWEVGAELETPAAEATGASTLRRKKKTQCATSS